MNKLTYSH